MSVDNTEYSIVNTAFRIFLTPRKKKAGEKENRERFGQRRVPAFPVCRKTEKPVTAVRRTDPRPAPGGRDARRVGPAPGGVGGGAWAAGGVRRRRSARPRAPPTSHKPSRDFDGRRNRKRRVSGAPRARAVKGCALAGSIILQVCTLLVRSHAHRRGARPTAVRGGPAPL